MLTDKGDGRIQDVADHLRFLAYRLDCAGRLEPGAAQRSLIAAIRSEAVSALFVLDVLAPTSNVEQRAA